MAKPTKASLNLVLEEYKRTGERAFLDKYEKGHAPDRWLIRIDGKLYPMKAVWVAAHTPPADPSIEDYRKAFRDLRDLGHIDVVSTDDQTRSPITAPTRSSVERAMAEFRTLGSVAFLDRYTAGHPPRSKYVREKSIDYPLKALYSAAHTPSAVHHHFSYTHAEAALTALGFNVVTLRQRPTDVPPEPPEDPAVVEGKRYLKELRVIRRNSAIVAAAKAARSPLTCDACDFDFEKRYGQHGVGFIEAHHIEPLSRREGEDRPTTIHDFAMLCANCHRMVHYGGGCLSVAEVRGLLKPI